MTVPTNLFIDAPEAEDPSLTQMGSDSNEWAEQAITKAKERVPAIAHFSLSVKFMAKDDEIGTATGSVTITDGERAAVVPVIIRDFLMYPLDVFFFEGKTLPFNGDFFSRAFSGDANNAFSSLTEYPMMNLFDRYSRGENLQNVIFPPNWGRYAYASAGDATEKYPLLAEVSASINGDEFKKKAMEDGASVARYEEKHPGLLRKLANFKPVNLAEFRQGVDNLVRRTIHVLKKDGPNKYTILSNAKNTFNPAMGACDRNDLRAFLSKASENVDDMLNDVDQNGEKLIVIEDNLKDTVHLALPKTGEIAPASHFGIYNVTTKTGINVEGLVVPKVIDFNQEFADTKIFLGKTISTMQPEIWGVEMTGQTRWFPEGSQPLVGQTGTFLAHEGMKGGVATLPVTIKSVMSVMDACGGSIKIKAVDMYGVDIDLRISPMKIERIVPMPDEKGGITYLVPGSMKWIPMEGFDDISSNPYAYTMKTADEKPTGPSIVIMDTGYGQYSMTGVNKYAHALEWDPTMLSRAEAKFMLASLGASEEKVASIMQKTAKEKFARVYGLNFPELWEEKVASYHGRAQELFNQAATVKRDFFKEASYIENAQTVDALLSLNFVNPENVSKFVGKIPLFKAAISHLASCLIASRIGIREIPEQAASSAMAKLCEVVNGLEALRSTQSPGKGA